MSIFKRGKIYWFHFLWNGRHVQRSTKQGNPRIARQIEAAHRTALARGEAGIVEPKAIPTFKAAMQKFLDWSKTEHAAHPSTYRRYKVSSVALLRYFKDSPLDKISPEEAECFKANRLEQKVTARGKENGKRKEVARKIRPATVNRELACLRAVFNHAIKGDVIVRNPISKTAARALREDNEQMRVLTFDEQEKYLAVATPLLRDVATLMLETGMRPEEVYRIQAENVNLAGSWLFNPYGKTKAARRRVPLNSIARGVLGRRIENIKAPFVFPCEVDDQRPVPKVNNAHDRAVKASRVAPFRLYDLRHTWATRAAEAGIDLVTLAALLGHSKIQMVMRYAHPSQEHQARSIERLETFMMEKRIESQRAQAGCATSSIQ